jgi:hypothetical protein
MRPAKLTEEHRDKLRPAVKSFGSSLRLMLGNKLLKFPTRKKSQQLAKEAVTFSHDGESPVGVLVFSFTSILPLRGSPFNPSSTRQNPCLGQE